MSRLVAKHWAIALVVSLAVNALVGGMLVARCTRGRGPGVAPDGLFPRPLHGLRRDLDPATYPTLDRIDAAHAERLEQRMRAVSDARLRAMSALSAESFDDRAAREALAEFRAKVGEAQDELHESLIEVAASVSPAQRRALGDAWGRAGYRRGPPDGSRGGPGRGRGRHRGGWRGGAPDDRTGAAADAPPPGPAPATASAVAPAGSQ